MTRGQLTIPVNFKVTPEDFELLITIRKAYKVDTMSQAIRMMIREKAARLQEGDNATG